MVRALIAFLFITTSFTGLLWLLGFDRGPDGLVAIAQAAAITLLCGLPALIWFCKCRWWQLWRFVAGGALGGALCALPFLGGNYSPLTLLMVFVALGIAHALLFWLLAVWRNRDLACPAFFRLPDGARYPVARHLHLKTQ